MAPPGSVCRFAVVKEKLFSRAAFKPSDADLNLIGEREEDTLMVESDDEPLKKSKAKVTHSDDEPISNLEGKGKANRAKKVQKSKSKSRRRLDDGDNDIDFDFQSDEDDDMSDFIIESDEDEEMDTPDEREVIFGHNKMRVSEEAIRLMPKLLPSTMLKVCSAALIFFNAWLTPLAVYDGGPHEGHCEAPG